MQNDTESEPESYLDYTWKNINYILNTLERKMTSNKKGVEATVKLSDNTLKNIHQIISRRNQIILPWLLPLFYLMSFFFLVWEENGEYWILDGHHRKYALQSLKDDGYIVPEKLPCNIVDVKNRKEAIKFLLTYSSEYAKPDKEGVSEFIHVNNLDFDELNEFIDLSSVDLLDIKLDSVDVDLMQDNKEPVYITCPNCKHEFVK